MGIPFYMFYAFFETSLYLILDVYMTGVGFAWKFMLFNYA